MNTQQTKPEIKEEFCSSCVAGAVAILGTATAGAGASSKKLHKKTKRFFIWFGIITFIFSIIIAIYMWKKNCQECR
jgi:hypothetical protein